MRALVVFFAFANCAAAQDAPQVGQIWWSYERHEAVEVIREGDCAQLHSEMSERSVQAAVDALEGLTLPSQRDFATEMASQVAPRVATGEESLPEGVCIAYGHYVTMMGTGLRIYAASIVAPVDFAEKHVRLDVR